MYFKYTESPRANTVMGVLGSQVFKGREAESRALQAPKLGAGNSPSPHVDTKNTTPAWASGRASHKGRKVVVVVEVEVVEVEEEVEGMGMVVERGARMCGMPLFVASQATQEADSRALRVSEKRRRRGRCKNGDSPPPPPPHPPPSTTPGRRAREASNTAEFLPQGVS